MLQNNIEPFDTEETVKTLGKTLRFFTQQERQLREHSRQLNKKLCEHQGEERAWATEVSEQMQTLAACRPCCNICMQVADTALDAQRRNTGKVSLFYPLKRILFIFLSTCTFCIEDNKVHNLNSNIYIPSNFNLSSPVKVPPANPPEEILVLKPEESLQPPQDFLREHLLQVLVALALRRTRLASKAVEAFGMHKDEVLWEKRHEA